MTDKVNLIIHAPSKSVFDIDDEVYLLRDQTADQWQSLYSDGIEFDALEMMVRGAEPLSSESIEVTEETVEMLEDEAIVAVSQIVGHFGWAGALYTRKHVNAYLGRPCTDEEWQAITATDAWKNITTMSEELERFMFSAIDEVVPDDEPIN